MLLQQQLEKIMRKKKFSKLVSSCQYYCLLGTVHTTSSAGGFDCNEESRAFFTGLFRLRRSRRLYHREEIRFCLSSGRDNGF